MKWLCVLGYILGLCGSAHAEPRAAVPYRSLITREAHSVYGLMAPIAMFAGQIEQESAWRPEVCSAYACGLTQFTAATAKDISRKHDLGAPDVFNPAWAIRAMILYDADLEKSFLTVKNSSDRWAFVLSSYNGGLGNARRDQALCLGPSCNRTLWWGHVELHSSRAAQFFRENRGYPRSILKVRQFTYTGWGGTIT